LHCTLALEHDPCTLHFQIGYQRVLVQSSLHPPSHVIEHVLASADIFSKVLMEMPEAAVAETAHAFANKMREPDQTVYEKAEKIADEVRIPSCLRLNHNAR
jgi:secreted Zn-dependent insulinase-like peptidase